MQTTLDQLIAEIPRLSSGILMLGIAGWLMLLDPAWRTGRLFALYMLVRGTLNLVLPFSEEGQVTGALNPFAAYAGYLHILLPFAALAFAVHFMDPARRRPVTNVALLVLLLAPLPLLGLYILDQSWMWASFGPRNGQLFSLVGLANLVYVLFGLLLYIESRRTPHAARRQGLRLLAFASVLFTVYAAAFDMTAVATGRLAWRLMSALGWTAALRVLGTVIAVAMVVSEVRSKRDRTGIWLIPSVVAAAFFSGMLPTLFPESLYWPVATFLNGAWTAAMPLAATVALSQYQLFGDRRNVRATLTLITATLGSLFVLVLMIQIFQDESAGIAAWLLGGALVLLLAVPLATRIVRAMVPVQDIGASHADRLEQYRKAHLLASSQGIMTRAQRRRLGRLRVRLDLPEDAAARFDGPVYLDD